MLRKFVFKILAFVVPLVFCAILIEFSLRNIPNDYQYKRDYLDTKSNEINTLILGNSHSYYGIDPSYFTTNTFNASYISQSLDYDFEILKKYQNKFENLRYIVIPISYFTLYSNLANGIEAWRIKSYIIYYHLGKSNSIDQHFELLSNKFNINTKRIWQYYLKCENPISCSSLGWGQGYSSISDDLYKTGILAAKRHTLDNLQSETAIKIFRENSDVLETILSWAKNRGIKVILFTPPAFISYRQNLSSIQLTNTIQKVEFLCTMHTNCVYYNLLSDSSFVAQDYHDADHLSDIGAKKLSLIMNNLVTNQKE